MEHEHDHNHHHGAHGHSHHHGPPRRKLHHHPTFLVSVGLVLVLIAVLVWTFVIW